MAKLSDLGPFFYPDSISIVGASQDETRPSGIIVTNLLNRFQGQIYPVNPKYQEIHNIQCFPSVKAIPADVSLSVIITPPSIIPGILEEHASKGIRHVIIATAGFSETEGGHEIEREIKNIASRAGIRVIGPNCLGVFHPSTGLDTFFLPYERVPRPQEGCISIISQSGSILGTTMILMQQEGFGIAKAVSYGNRVDVSEPELLEYLDADDETGVIGVCMESISDGRRFIRAAQKCRKPVVIIKLGQQPAGKKAARSHTGSIAGSYDSFQAAFRRGGVSEARTIEEFVDLLKVFSMQKPVVGRSVLILTNAGGIGVMTADLCNREGLDVPDLQPVHREELKSLLPPYYSLSNPVDLTGSSTDEEYSLVLRTCLADFDAVILIPFMTVPGITPYLADAIINSVQNFQRPIVSLCAFAKDGERLEESFKRHGIPVFPSPQRAVKSLAQLLKKRPVEPLPERVRNYPGVISILDEIKKGGRGTLSPGHKKRLLDVLGLKCPKVIRARTQAGAVSAASEIGFPVALKVASPDILHKTDAGGVRVNIRSIKELRQAYKEVHRSVMLHMPDARIHGVDIEEMALPGVEIIIGGIRDPQFGPIVMFGLGGVFVETLKDVVFEIAPVTYKGASRMSEAIQGYPLLQGMRGKEGVDLDAIAKAIVSVSELMASSTAIEEIEFNPAIAHPSGMTVVDTRIILAPA